MVEEFVASKNFVCYLGRISFLSEKHFKEARYV